MMTFKKNITVVLLFFMYTNIVVTQQAIKVKEEKIKKNSNKQKIKKTEEESVIKADEAETLKSVQREPVANSEVELSIPKIQEIELLKDDKNSSITGHEVDMVNYFCKPIDFTPDGIAYYFKYVYNHPEYVYHLPYNLSHMIQFLKYGVESGQNEAFAASVIKMFLQKMKAAPYVEAESFAAFMPEFVKAMKPYLEKKEAKFLEDMQITLKNKLSEMFARYFNVFQKNPDEFMNSLAGQIVKQSNQSATQQHVETEQLKKDVVRFFEICTNKLIWSEKEDIQSWYNCNRLAHECQICLENGIICDTNALDDMCWSIIHRFCYFVDLSKESLSKDFYTQILDDLQTKPLLLVALEEQEDLMTKKREHMICKIKNCRDVSCSRVLLSDE